MSAEFRLGPRLGMAHTQEETAQHFGVSRQYVQQVEKRALAKLRRILAKKYGAKRVADLL